MSGFEPRKPNTFIHTDGDERITVCDAFDVCVDVEEAGDLVICHTESEMEEIISRATVEKEGYSYFIVDTDLQKGDRRCDGKFMADFFNVTDVEESSVKNCRQSQRVHKRYIAETLLIENQGVAAYKASLESATAHKKPHIKLETQGESMDIERMVITPTLDEGTVAEQIEFDSSNDVSVPPEEDDFDITMLGRGLRRPDEGIRCAGRSGTTRLLWVHEFYVVNEGTSSKRNCVMYQALQFLLGAHLPAGSVDNMTEESRRDIWVLGVRHVPALFARPGHARRRGYLFHSEFNDGDARTALMGTCPELVRVDNGLKWHNTHSISTEVP
jgi:hypothetical protein